MVFENVYIWMGARKEWVISFSCVSFYIQYVDDRQNVDGGYGNLGTTGLRGTAPSVGRSFICHRSGGGEICLVQAASRYCTYYLFCTEVGVPRGSEQNSPPSTVSGRHAYSLYDFVARKTDNCMYSVCSLQIIQMKVTEMFSITLAKQIRYDGGWDPYLPTSVLAEIDHLRELQFISCGTLMKYIETTIR